MPGVGVALPSPKTLPWEKLSARHAGLLSTILTPSYGSAVTCNSEKQTHPHSGPGCAHVLSLPGSLGAWQSHLLQAKRRPSGHLPVTPPFPHGPARSLLCAVLPTSERPGPVQLTAVPTRPGIEPGSQETLRTNLGRNNEGASETLREGCASTPFQLSICRPHVL